MAAAQQAPAPATSVKPAGSLKIVVIEGEGAKNSIRAKSATAPAVEVRDENDKPVAGAEAVFQLPATGAGGVFHGWMRSQTVKTDAQGQARTTGYVPNDEEGRFNIKVTATQGARTATAVIAQSNVRGSGAQASPARKGWVKWVAVLGGAAVIGGVVKATRGGETVSATTTAPVVISPGPVTVSGPR
jgi:hypothetical protein